MRALRSADQRGAALIEFALVLLPLCTIIFGAIDLGRAYLQLDQLRNSAQAGAIFARQYPTQVSTSPDQDGDNTCQEPPTGTGSIMYQTANEFSAGGPTGSSSLPSGYALQVKDMTTPTTLTGCGPDYTTPITVTSAQSCPAVRSANTVCSGDYLQIQVTEPFHLMTPLIGGLVGSITLHGTAVVRIP